MPGAALKTLLSIHSLTQDELPKHCRTAQTVRATKIDEKQTMLQMYSTLLIRKDFKTHGCFKTYHDFCQIWRILPIDGVP